MDPVLRTHQLSKSYGAIRAVELLDLEINKGQVYGILGPNGSGKTTTLGMILGIIIPSGGKFEWFNQMPLNKALYRIGSIIETPAFYPYLSGSENLKIISDIKSKGKDEINDVLVKVGLEERKNHSYKGYSLGMKQRLALAAAMLGRPEVMVLDEPTNGMDPQGIADIRDLIVAIAAQGTTIILASHLLDEVQKTCSHVAVLKKGKKIFDGSVQDILQSEEYFEIWSEDPELLLQLLNEFKGIEELKKEREKYVFKLAPGPDKKDLQKHLIKHGVYPTHFVSRGSTLENKFLELLKEEK